MSLLRAAVVTVVVMFMLPVSYGTYVMWSDWYYKQAPLTPQQKVEQAVRQVSDTTRRCIEAEVAEGAADEDDQMIIAYGMIKLMDRGRDPCHIFLKYTQMRAPSQEDGWSWLRDPGFVLEGKGQTRDVWGKRVASARRVADKALKGDFSFVAKNENPLVVEKRRAMLQCPEIKYDRVWPTNSARTSVEAMSRETDQTIRFVSPAGTKFFCNTRPKS